MDAATMATACTSTGRFVEHVTDDQLSLPTPCDAWDVRSLLNHLVGSLILGESLLSGSEPSVPVEPGGLPAEDVLGDDPLEAYRTQVASLLAVATDDVFGGMLSTPMGEIPGAVLGGISTLDIAMHGWDLAVATGQDPTLDEDLATRLLGFARQTLGPEMRGDRIAPAVPVDSTSTTDQLAAFLGRTP